MQITAQHSKRNADLDIVPLGATGMEITRVGFGAWAISGSGWRYAWGSQDDRDSVATIRAAAELGINWIDTAAVYGLGHSEALVGRALRQMPEADRPLVFTKCGLTWDDAYPTAPPRKVMTPRSVRRELEASLRRLGVERIDLYQVHWPADGQPLEYVGEGQAVRPVPVEEYWQLMADLRAAGKVRAIGLSNHTVDQLRTAQRVAPVDVLQPPFSALNRSAAPEIAWSQATGAGVIAYSPMHSGLLTGAFSAERVAALPADDWRSSHLDFTDRLPANLALAGALRPIAERRGVTVAAVAVAWTLHWPGITGAIVGARRPGQIADWLPGASVRLTPADLSDITDALNRTKAGEGPTQP